MSSGEGRQEQLWTMEIIMKWNWLFFPFVFSHWHSVIGADVQQSIMPLLSSQSIRTHSHCSVLATGRDELVSLGSWKTNFSPDPVCQSRLQLCSDSQPLRRLTVVSSLKNKIAQKVQRRSDLVKLRTVKWWKRMKVFFYVTEVWQWVGVWPCGSIYLY